MSELKKAFRGYRVADVDQRLSELENQMNAATSRCAELERQLSEARRAADDLQARLTAREAELHRVNRAYERIATEQSGKKSAEESIGHIYIKAFENGRDVVLSPREHVDQFLSDVDAAAQRARSDLAAAQRDFSGVSDQIVHAVARINDQTQAILDRLRELSANVGGLDGAYAGFDRVRQATHAEICEIQAAYEQSAGLYLDSLNRSRRPARTSFPAGAQSEPTAPIRPAEPARQTAEIRPSGPVTASDVPPAVEAAPQPEPEPIPDAQATAAPTVSGAGAPDPDQTPDLRVAAAAAASEPDPQPAEARPQPVQQDVQPAPAGDSAAVSGGEKADVRGQHILDLLHKYQKR